MSQMSRRCVPYTPLDRPLDRTTVALVTAAGVHRRDQEAFNIADDLGDLTFRILGPDVRTEELMVTHHHYDHTDADEDINVGTEEAFDLTRRLARQEGVLVGSSSGANLGGALRVARRVSNAVIVVIFCDGGEKYLSERFWDEVPAR